MTPAERIAELESVELEKLAKEHGSKVLDNQHSAEIVALVRVNAVVAYLEEEHHERPKRMAAAAARFEEHLKAEVEASYDPVQKRITATVPRPIAGPVSEPEDET